MASGKPLTEFLLALSHSRELAQRFSDPDQRNDVLEQWGLGEHDLFTNGDPTLEEVQAAVAEEHTAGATVRRSLSPGGSGSRRPDMSKRPEWIWGVDDKPDDDDDAAGATDSDDDEDADDDGGTST